MVKTITINQTRDMLIYTSQQIISNESYLDEMDRAIGDGDHGLSMARGFEKVIELLNMKRSKSIADIFLSIGNELIFTIGGSAGIVFGTFFRGGSKALIGKQKLDSSSIIKFLQLAMDAIIQRGGAKPGDKTMIDALYPAVIKVRELNNDIVSISTTLNIIADTAFDGMGKTMSMKGNIGRAKKYGDASIGHLDPGAITTYLILRSMSDFVNYLPGNLGG